MSLESDSAFHAKQLFVQGSYSSCIQTIDSIGPNASANLRLYAARSHIALGNLERAVSITSSIDTPAGKAVKLLADSVNDQDGAAADEAFELLEDLGEDVDGTTRAVLGTILANQEDYRGQAIEVLTAGANEENQECVALLIQLYLSMDRLDLAKSTYTSAKVWAEDSTLIQLCEAWISLKTGGEESGGYQTAFYCYDEMSQLPGANNTVVLNGKAVCQAALHRWPEAEAPLQEASSILPNNATTLANTAAVAALSGKPSSASEQALATLRQIAPSHPLVQDILEKEAAFDEAAARFSVSVAA